MTRLLRPRPVAPTGPGEPVGAETSSAHRALAASRAGRSGSQRRLAHVGVRSAVDDPFAVDAVLRTRLPDAAPTDDDPDGHDDDRDGADDPAALAGGDPGAGARGLSPLDFAGTGAFAAAPDVMRWVPIGPSVVRLGQADGRPLVTGRISDLQVSPDGRRLYASSAKGGLWYSGDAGATWDPVGNWANAARGPGGNLSGLAIGAILVTFGATAAQDHVVVGTGELTPFQTQHGAGRVGGIGILSAVGPATWQLGNPAWNVSTGTLAVGGLVPAPANPNALFGLGVYRLVRRPGSIAGTTAPGATRDIIVACTSAGAFVGAAVAGGYQWRPVTGTAGSAVTDAVWIPNGANGRLFLTRQGNGVDFYDDIVDPTVLVAANPGFTHTPNPVLVPPVPPAAAAPLAHSRRASLATNDNSSVVYVLGELPGPQVGIWQIPNPTAAVAAVRASGPSVDPSMTYANLWSSAGNNLYAHGFDAGGTGVGTDQLFIGGAGIRSSFFGGQTRPNANFTASLWGFDIAVVAVGAGPGALTPIAGVSDVAGARADMGGLIGNNVHADIHQIHVDSFAATPTSFTIVGNLATITVASAAGLGVGDVVTVAGTANPVLDGSHTVSAVTATTFSYPLANADIAATPTGGTATARTVWVGCDGGVYRSQRGGAVHTFQPRHSGLSVIEAGYVANHPTSRQYVMVGSQDNGVVMRVGETVYEHVLYGDGGGVAFHQNASQDVIGQWTAAQWRVLPNRGTNANTQTQRARGQGAWVSMPSAGGASFYSGVAANGQRIALGTDRVFLADSPRIPQDLANWQILPVGAAAPPVAATAPLGPGTTPGLGRVHTVKWIDNTNLVALYSQGVVLYSEAPVGQWTGTVVLPIAAGGDFFNPPAVTVVPTDLAPVPGLTAGSVYLTTATRSTIADPAGGPAITDTAFMYDRATNTLSGLGLDGGGGTPIDPASSVVVDRPPAPANHVVYVGTATGVQRRDPTVPPAPPGFVWTPMVNGTPDTAVQDLAIWTDPGGAAAPRLLRAALQSRGVWEVDLSAAAEPQRTYVRTHTWDARRQLPTPMANPRLRPAAVALPALDSPDIVVRPAVPAAPPRWRGPDMTADTPFSRYQLWTFQTAFRWRWPSVVADGRMTDAFQELVTRERTIQGRAGTSVDRALWDDVVGATDDAGDLFVYRAPWTDVGNPTLPATEVDLIDLVIPRRDSRGVWLVYREPSVVEVLIHHRDTRPLDPGAPPPLVPQRAHATLLWRSSPSQAALVGADTSGIVAYVRSLVGGGAALPVPAGWNVEQTAAGSALHQLTVPLSARMPRAVPIPLDLSIGNGPGQVPFAHKFVLLIAVVGSSVDQFGAAPAGATDTPANLVRNWPHAAARLLNVSTRP